MCGCGGVCVLKAFATHHDDGGVCWKLLAGAIGGSGHSAGQLLITQLVHAVREALHLADRQQHGGVFGLHRQHLTLGVERGDLLLVATDLLGQLLSKHPPQEHQHHRHPQGQESVAQSTAEDQYFLIK